MRSTAAALCVAALVVAAEAGAQDTIGVYADFGDGGELSRSLIVKEGEPFDIVVVTKTDHTSKMIQFEMTELQNLYSGVFKYSTTRYGGVAAVLGDDDIGEQVFSYGDCADPGENEILRVRYYDIGGTLPDNVVVSVSDPGPDNTYPEMMGGAMLYSDCTLSEFHQLMAEPWEDGSSVDPMLIEGLSSADGILVLNPVGLSVSSDAGSFSTLKSSFR